MNSGSADQYFSISGHVKKLMLVRDGRLVLAGIDLVWRAGEALVLTGPNGSGKTSLLRYLAGLLTQDHKLEWRDQAGQVIEPPGSIYYGYRPPVKASWPVMAHLDYWTDLYGTISNRELLGKVDLWAVRDLPARILSEGQKKRLDLVRLLLSGMPCWLMDEPLAGLDGAGQLLVADIIRDHLARGGWVALATHQPLENIPCQHLNLGACL